MTLTLGELFAGYGGLGMAVETAFNARLTWYAEFDEAPSKIMAHHWPGIPNHRDVSKVDWASVEPVDIISGGSPCQDLSTAGKRRGMTDGTRSNLWVSMREAIAIIKPKYVVWENVRGAYTTKADSSMEYCPGCMGGPERAGKHLLRALGRVLGDLSDLGYDAQWRGLPASSVGAPHNRFRVFILATRRDVVTHPHSIGTSGRNGAPRNFEIQGANHPASVAIGGTGQPWPTTADTPCQRSGKGLDRPEGIARTEVSEPRSGGTPAAHTQHHGHAPGAGGRSHGAPTTAGAGAKSESKDHDGESSGGHTPNGEPGHFQINWGIYEPAIRRWEELRGPAPDPTELNANGKHRLNAQFSEWMMGLAPGHVTDVPGLTYPEQIKALGNGVVPQQAGVALIDMLNYEVTNS